MIVCENVVRSATVMGNCCTVAPEIALQQFALGKMTSKVTEGNGALRSAVYHLLLVVRSSRVSILHRLRDFSTF